MIFPIQPKPENRFWEPGTWSFGATRWTDKDKDGIRDREEVRQHAGVDLYCRNNTPVYAMESCRVVRVTDSFYLGTGCVECVGLYAIRYGEIIPAEIKLGDGIPEGTIIGWVKKCEGIKQPMLHLEMYGVGVIGRPSLTDLNRPPFYRTIGLIDPTAILKECFDKSK